MQSVPIVLRSTCPPNHAQPAHRITRNPTATLCARCPPDLLPTYPRSGPNPPTAPRTSTLPRRRLHQVEQQVRIGPQAVQDLRQGVGPGLRVQSRHHPTSAPRRAAPASPRPAHRTGIRARPPGTSATRWSRRPLSRRPAQPPAQRPAALVGQTASWNHLRPSRSGCQSRAVSRVTHRWRRAGIARAT